MSIASVKAKVKRALGTVFQKHIWGELAPWLYFVLICAFFGVMTSLGKIINSETQLGLLLSLSFGLLLSFLCWLFFLVLYGRVLCHRASKRIVYLFSLLCFLSMGVVFSWQKVVLLLAGVFAIVMGVCVMVCAYSWLFRFRGGRIVGLLIVFALASVLYSKLQLTFDNYPYASEPVVEPFHIANQLVGVALPVRGQFNEVSVSTIKPLLYEGCHFFIWLFLISLAVSFTNRELINRLYLKLTQFKPLYVFWSNNGSSEEEAVAADIVRGKLFRPNVVLALWGKDKENAADVCDKWKRGRRWIEASSAEYDDIASHANVHYILSSDGNENLKRCMSLMPHVVSSTIYVKTDGADDSFLKVFQQCVAKSLRVSDGNLRVKVFSEVALIENEILNAVPKNSAKNKVFVVNYFKGSPVSGTGGNVLTEKDKELAEKELPAMEKLANRLCVPATQIVGCRDASLAQAGTIVFGGIEPRFQMKAIAEYYSAWSNTNARVYAYAKDKWLVDLLHKCYNLRVFGNAQSLFALSRIEQVATDPKIEEAMRLTIDVGGRS